MGDSLANKQEELLFLHLSQYSNVFASHPANVVRTVNAIKCYFGPIVIVNEEDHKLSSGTAKK